MLRFKWGLFGKQCVFLAQGPFQEYSSDSTIFFVKFPDLKVLFFRTVNQKNVLVVVPFIVNFLMIKI